MRLIILSLIAIIGTTIGLQLPVELESSVQFISRADLLRLLRNNPHIELTSLEKKQTKESIQYTIGNRVSGDRLVSQTANSQNWGAPQDVRLTLQYPTSGTGAVVSYAIVTVQQSTNLGQGYIVSGGIGQRSIVVIIEAYSTTYLSYLAQVYGK